MWAAFSPCRASGGTPCRVFFLFMVMGGGGVHFLLAPPNRNVCGPPCPVVDLLVVETQRGMRGKGFHKIILVLLVLYFL